MRVERTTDDLLWPHLATGCKGDPPVAQTVTAWHVACQDCDYRAGPWQTKAAAIGMIDEHCLESSTTGATHVGLIVPDCEWPLDDTTITEHP